MAVSLKLADAFVDISVNRAAFNTGLASVIADLGRLRGMGVIDLRLDRGAATASLGLLRQQLDALRKDATVNVTVRQRVTGAGGRDLGGGLFGGGGGGGVGPAGSLGMGLMQGLGVAGFAMNPAMMAGATVGAGIKDAVSTAMDLEQTFVGLQRVTGESAENIEKFKRSIFDIGKTQAGVSIKDLTDIAMAGAKAGISDKEGIAGLERFTAGLAKVRNSVQGIGTEQLADNMTRIFNLFGKGTDYVQSFGSVLAKMDNVSTASAGSLMEMTKSLSGTMASLGSTIPETMTFASVLADAGLSAQQGASSFSQIFRSMASKGGTFAEAAGVPLEEWTKLMNTGQLLTGLRLLTDKFKEIQAVDPTKAQEWLRGLGLVGVRTAGAFQQVVAVMDKIPERLAMAKEEETTLASLQAANELNSTTALSNLQKLKNAYDELSAAIGKVTLGPLTQLAKDALTIVNGLGKPAGAGAPGGKATSPLSVGEGLQFVGMTMMNAIGGAIPESPEFQDKLNAFKRRLEESFAAGDKKALETPALTPEERKDANAIGIQQGWAEAVKENAPGGGGGPGGGLGFAREQDRIQAEMFRREAEDRERARAETLAGRGAALARPGGIPEVSDFRKKFMEPGELAEVERRKAMEFIARPREEEKARPSQMFTDPADYATHAIQAALSAKDDSPKQTAEATKRAAVLIQTLVDAIIPVTKITPGKPNAGMFIFQHE
jgi:TP901 family phage tail tape measure protein